MDDDIQQLLNLGLEMMFLSRTHKIQLAKKLANRQEAEFNHGQNTDETQKKVFSLALGSYRVLYPPSRSDATTVAGGLQPMVLAEEKPLALRRLTSVHNLRIKHASLVELVLWTCCRRFNDGGVVKFSDVLENFELLRLGLVTAEHKPRQDGIE